MKKCPPCARDLDLRVLASGSVEARGAIRAIASRHSRNAVGGWRFRQGVCLFPVCLLDGSALSQGDFCPAADASDCVRQLPPNPRFLKNVRMKMPKLQVICFPLIR